MESQLNIRETVSHPKGRSLEAYKAWVMEIARRLTKDATKIKLTEEERIANWKEYWQETFSNQFWLVKPYLVRLRLHYFRYYQPPYRLMDVAPLA
ncbi:MAG: hypothetical protein ABIU06_02035 [Anaerolineales bacterium]